MSTSLPIIQIPFQGTIMHISRYKVNGMVVFNITFADGRPAASITRKKDAAGYYWISILPMVPIWPHYYVNAS
jgi:hypothetical protein